jgi:hypothetical protein
MKSIFTLLMSICSILFATNLSAQVLSPTVGGMTVHCSDATGTPVYTVYRDVPDAAQSAIVSGTPTIFINSQRQTSMPPMMQLFVYAHECGHHISGDIVAATYFGHDNLAREQNADRIGIRLMRDQLHISLADAQNIAASFQHNPAVPPYYLPGPLRAQWIVACYGSSDDQCAGSTVDYSAYQTSPPPPITPSHQYKFGPLARGTDAMPQFAAGGDLCDNLKTAIDKIPEHLSSFRTSEKIDLGDISSLTLAGSLRCFITDQDSLMCDMSDEFDDLVDSVKACLEPLDWTATVHGTTRAKFLPPAVKGYFHGSINISKAETKSGRESILSVWSTVVKSAE